MKLGPSGAEFEFGVEQARAKAELEIDQPASADTPAVSEDLMELAEKDPKAAVLLAASDLERALRYSLTAVGDEEGAKAKRGAIWLARRSAEKGGIEKEVVSVVGDMTLLRNLAAHGRDDMDPKAAREYLETVTLLTNAVYQGPDH